jgi:hypothetical protein
LNIDFNNGDQMTTEWNELTKMTHGKPVTIERVRVVDSGIAIEGSFAPPPLASLSAEDQVFVMAFIRCHGSIKEMEEMFGISYPTVKSRLNRIARQFEFAEIVKIAAEEEVIDELERGEISAEEAIRRLSK